MHPSDQPEPSPVQGPEQSTPTVAASPAESSRPAGPVAGTRRSKSGLVALLVSALALLVAFGAVAFAWRALDQANDARDLALRGAPAGDTARDPAPVPEPTIPGAGPSVPDTPRPPGEPPVLNEQTVYEPHYQKEQLTLRPVDCLDEMYVDVDEPRVNVSASVADLLINRGCNGRAPSVQAAENVAVTDQARPGMTPQECYEAIRTMGLPAEAKIPVTRGNAICLSTDYGAARARSDRWRLVLIEVTGISNDGDVIIQATAWNIPG